MHLLYLQFYIYERLKQLLSSSAQSNAHPSTIQTLLCGGLVGSTAALFTTPFDVVKTRLQTETSLKWIMAMQMDDIACCSFYHEQVSILEQMNMSSSLAIWNASYWGLHLYSRVFAGAFVFGGMGGITSGGLSCDCGASTGTELINHSSTNLWSFVCIALPLHLPAFIPLVTPSVLPLPLPKFDGVETFPVLPLPLTALDALPLLPLPLAKGVVCAVLT
ncbi:hypothetical protein GIB67_003953 [Kingdonia uniflora]|uniref:Mitochondrial carrier protein n=1 Tax=Kingdonia uniflora TaxID=39325 RepID=A0A7J7NQV7_9MAGN|nr:hypothetical protein GIB67_003953 [Kingdonia uniflora]